jgi:hypothetical protein
MTPSSRIYDASSSHYYGFRPSAEEAIPRLGIPRLPPGGLH